MLHIFIQVDGCDELLPFQTQSGLQGWYSNSLVSNFSIIEIKRTTIKTNNNCPTTVEKHPEYSSAVPILTFSRLFFFL